MLSASLGGLHPAPRPKSRQLSADVTIRQMEKSSSLVSTSVPARCEACVPRLPSVPHSITPMDLKGLAASFPDARRKASTPAYGSVRQTRAKPPSCPTQRTRTGLKSEQGALAARPEGNPTQLQQQMARSVSSSEDLLRRMRSTFARRFDPSELLLQLPTRHLLVGKCKSQHAGTAKFLTHKVIYAFEHPVHRHVEMHMAYSDMVNVRVLLQGATGGQLCFRIASALAYFTREYDHTNQSHELRIGFLSDADFQRFLAIAPRIVDQCMSSSMTS